MSRDYNMGVIVMQTDDGETDERKSVIMRAYGKVCDIAIGAPSKEHTEGMDRRKELRARVDRMKLEHAPKGETSP